MQSNFEGASEESPIIRELCKMEDSLNNSINRVVQRVEVLQCISTPPAKRKVTEPLHTSSTPWASHRIDKPLLDWPRDWPQSSDEDSEPVGESERMKDPTNVGKNFTHYQTMVLRW